MQTPLAAADAWLHRWRPTVRARALIGLAFAVSAALQIVGVPFTSSFGTRTRIDLDVYRLGGQIWQQGQSLYADGSMPFTSDGIWLPFTYPPFAALTFVPLGAMGLLIAGIVISLLTTALLVVVLHIVMGVLSVGDRANRWWLALAVAAPALWSNPMWMTLGFGQINVILMTSIVVDVFVVGRGRWAVTGPLRGVLIGLASAIKLTPLVFVGVFLAARRWRAAVVSVATFVAAGAIAWIWLPSDSLGYWTHTLFHTTRIGDPAGRINQNLNAFWIRLLPADATTEQIMWLVSSLAVTALAIVAVLACRPVAALAADATPGQRVDAVLALAVVAIWGLLVSPTSWAHHWVWSIPIIVALVTVAARSAQRSAQTVYLALALVGAVIFTVGPFQLLRPAFLGWSPLDHVVGNSYTLWGLAVLVAVWRLPFRANGPGRRDSAPALADARS
ncbi:glycosyltransferase 87 family protein [Gordonia soli]|uniref:Putative mannosyltransferase n=1 Tax=Gordonia soli NBRC 108243 TaxID=1223545 RepID=M0QLT3_9ACTN|nr:glycosyltransferase 87 family protein [Gordonia soli]GAC69533.1 putative mannosyltransferase [Gordonia soli NBRC 108243]